MLPAHEDDIPVSVLLNPISLGEVSMDLHNIAVSCGGEKGTSVGAGGYQMMSRGLCYSLQALHISWNRRLLWINQNISILNVKPQSLSITIFDNCKTKCLEPKSSELLTTTQKSKINDSISLVISSQAMSANRLSTSCLSAQDGLVKLVQYIPCHFSIASSQPFSEANRSQ